MNSNNIFKSLLCNYAAGFLEHSKQCVQRVEYIFRIGD
jgi:hypothetical protein